MKIINVILVTLVMGFILFRVIGPKLISEKSDAAVVVGAACIIAGLYYLFKTMYDYLQGEDE